MDTPINERELEARLESTQPLVRMCATEPLANDFYTKGGCDAGVACPYQSRKYHIKTEDNRQLPGCLKYSRTLRRKVGLDAAQ